jgi:hypothetical protein
MYFISSISISAAEASADAGETFAPLLPIEYEKVVFFPYFD